VTALPDGFEAGVQALFAALIEFDAQRLALVACVEDGEGGEVEYPFDFIVADESVPVRNSS
jgi:hypothetical protein